MHNLLDKSVHPMIRFYLFSSFGSVGVGASSSLHRKDDTWSYRHTLRVQSSIVAGSPRHGARLPGQGC
ncbi:hypothetical protein MPTK2_3g11510 [Marchantia polymorpha subsp. ruderalis]